MRSFVLLAATALIVALSSGSFVPTAASAADDTLSQTGLRDGGDGRDCESKKETPTT